MTRQPQHQNQNKDARSSISTSINNTRALSRDITSIFNAYLLLLPTMPVQTRLSMPPHLRATHAVVEHRDISWPLTANQRGPVLRGLIDFLVNGFQTVTSADHCPTCRESGQVQVRLKRCGHTICLTCIALIANTETGNLCPHCRTVLYDNDVLPYEPEFVSGRPCSLLLECYPEKCPAKHCDRYFRNTDALHIHIASADCHFTCSHFYDEGGLCTAKAFSSDEDVERHEVMDREAHPDRCPIPHCTREGNEASSDRGRRRHQMIVRRLRRTSFTLYGSKH